MTGQATWPRETCEQPTVRNKHRQFRGPAGDQSERARGSLGEVTDVGSEPPQRRRGNHPSLNVFPQEEGGASWLHRAIYLLLQVFLMLVGCYHYSFRLFQFVKVIYF